MPKKAAMIWILVMGSISLADGLVKHNKTEIVVSLAMLIYAIFTLLALRKEKRKQIKQQITEDNLPQA